MTALWGDIRVERHLCLRDAAIHLDDDGLLSDPDGEWASALNPNVVGVEDVREPRCVAIIGEPGSGKSETVGLHAPLLREGLTMPSIRIDLAEYGTEDRLARALFDHPDVLAWRAADEGDLCVVLDSLDECQARVSHISTVLGRELMRWPTDRLYLRICCRTGDWPEGLQQQLQQLYGDVHVFELLPLTRRAVADLATAAGVVPGNFLAAVRNARVGPLAAKPLTLQMLLRLYDRHGELPADPSALYADALLLLADEPAQRRRDARSVGLLSASDRVATASRLAALSTFGQVAAFWTGRPDERADTDLAVRDCAGGTEPTPSGAVAISEDAVRETLRTGLFTSRGSGRVGWAHHTFAENLAAKFLVAHSPHPRQVESLLIAPDGQVYPQLRAVGAWLMAISPAGEYDWLVERDPELFLTAPVDVQRTQVRARAVAGLFRLAEEAGYRRRFEHRFDGLDYPGLTTQVRDHLANGTTAQRRLALNLASDCPMPDLRDDLVAVVLDNAEDYQLRIAAAQALLAATDQAPTTELRTLALDPSGDDDPDDQLKGYALRLSWPHAITTREMFDALTPPRRTNLIGAYAMFVQYEVPDSLGASDVGVALDWLLTIERANRRHGRLDRLADRIVELALDGVGDPAVADGLAELALLRGAAHESLFVDRISRPDLKPELTSDQRHRVTTAALHRIRPDDAIRLVDYTTRGRGIVIPEDLAWLVDQFDASPQHRDVLAELVGHMFHPDVPGHAQLALDLPAGHALRDGPLAYWLTTVALDSEQAHRARERQRRWQGFDEPADDQPPPTDSEIEQRITSYLQQFEDGDPDGFWQACWLLHVPPGADTLNDEFDPDLTAQPRWKALPNDLRNRILRSARTYLDVGDCNPDAWLGSDTFHRPAYAGYRALILLLRLAPGELDSIPAGVWARWAPIVLAAYTAHGAGTWDDKQVPLGYARVHAPEELFSTAITLVERDSERGEPIHHRRELGLIWTAQLAAWLRDAVLSGALQDRTRGDAMALLAEHDPSGARQMLTTILTEGPDPEQRGQAGALLLAHDAQSSWTGVHAVLHDEPELGEQIVTAYVTGARYDDSTPALPDADLAELFLWLVRRFPYADDPQFDDVHAVGPREEIGHWRDRILRTLTNRGTHSAVDAIRRIEAALPQHPWLRDVRRDAETVLRGNIWRPVSPRELLNLVAAADRRFVTTAANLADIVVDALATVQTRLTGETPESHLLWDTTSGRPKVEEEISDYLRNRLHDLLVTHRVVVNREVQVRSMGRGMGERTDLRIEAVHTDAHNATPLTVVVEVKGAWHPNLMENLRSQLVQRYMSDIPAAHGVYLVVWPDLNSWTGNSAEKRRVAARHAGTTRHDLDQDAALLISDGVHVRVVHLNIARTRPTSDTGQRQPG